MERTDLVNLEWLDTNFPCMAACPVHTEAGRYVELIAEGNFREAYNVARKTNPFASICGRVCAAPCEASCRRKVIDEPIAIRALKRFACERFGVESMVDLDKLRGIFGKSLPRNGIPVAIIGAGPAGLSCAHDLALLGYDVTVFEAQSVAGGMLRLGIPEYRLPRELIRLEVNFILSLGVTLRLNAAIGRDFTIADLRAAGFQSIFLAIGAHKGRTIPVEGNDLDGVLRAVDFLLNANLGYRVELGKNIVVIGGGNVAFDAARTAARVEHDAPPSVSSVSEALDVARSAVRFGATNVTIVCLEDSHEMLADKEEIEAAHDERITILTRRGPQKIVGENGRVTGLQTRDCLSVFDAQGKFNPTFREGSEKIVEADTVILAIGQTSDLTWLKPEDGVEVTPRNTIKIDPVTLATSAPGIFAGGDVSFGPRNAIDAIANGKLAAQSMHAFLNGEQAVVPRQVSITVSREYRREWGYESCHRVPVPMLATDRRVGVAQIELGYDEASARKEASRCLHCWVNTIFEEKGEEHGTECIQCGGCVDVCPEKCIDLISTERILADESLRAEIDQQFDFATLIEGGAAMVKDETRCIRCGLCAQRCPVGTITMENFVTSSPLPV